MLFFKGRRVFNNIFTIKRPPCKQSSFSNRLVDARRSPALLERADSTGEAAVDVSLSLSPAGILIY